MLLLKYRELGIRVLSVSPTLLVMRYDTFKIKVTKSHHKVFGRVNYMLEVESMLDRLAWLNKSFYNRSDTESYIKFELLPILSGNFQVKVPNIVEKPKPKPKKSEPIVIETHYKKITLY
jgi:hypothetical protein